LNIIATTPHYMDSQGFVLKNSITCLEKIKVGGIDQWLLIRGVNKKNPVLLFVHGGPGQSNMYLSHVLDKELEKHFTVVNWDQRGAAKSLTKHVKPETMNLEQLVQDAGEVIQYIRTKLQTDKVYVLGHSFGTILGMLIVQRYPQYIHSYIGLSQCVGLLENLTVSYSYVMREAQKAGDHKAVKELRAIGTPPFHNFTKGLWKYSVLLEKYGGKVHNRPGREIFKAVFTAPEYSLFDKVRFFRGVLFSVKHMHKELLATDLRALVRKVNVPVYFFLGKYDQSTPSELAVQYLEQLQAPRKELVWFENSAHMSHYEEPERFVQEVLRVLHPNDGKKGVIS
jgi:pimeloyl-ACP methyl ester carboxylesterase